MISGDATGALPAAGWQSCGLEELMFLASIRNRFPSTFLLVRVSLEPQKAPKPKVFFWGAVGPCNPENHGKKRTSFGGHFLLRI